MGVRMQALQMPLYRHHPTWFPTVAARRKAIGLKAYCPMSSIRTGMHTLIRALERTAWFGLSFKSTRDP